ncbi:MAG: DNA-processing protein DprA [Nitrososphaeria archaeon]
MPLGGPRVAVVGTRRPSSAGLGAARLIAGRLAERGAIIVSGLARGIDTAAHRAAIERGGRTIAVLGTPLDGFYPPENRDLQLEIMREHLAVSQFPLGHVTRPRDFLARDRTIALIADAVVIVEAGPAGGTAFTGRAALRLGRPLWIWRDVFNDPALTWPWEMVGRGARRLDEDSVDSIIKIK